MQPECGIYISRQESSGFFFFFWGNKCERKRRKGCCVQTPVARHGFQVNQDTNVKENTNHDRSVGTQPTTAWWRAFAFCFCVFSFLKIFYFIFGCAGSSFLVGVLWLSWGGLLAVYSGFPCRRAQAPGMHAAAAAAHGLSSCGALALLPRGMWDLLRPGMKPASLALAGGFLTTGPSGKPCLLFFFFFPNHLRGSILQSSLQTIQALVSQSETQTFQDIPRGQVTVPRSAHSSYAASL